jgi:hypothetical protein
VSLVVCVELLLMYQIPHGEVHILHIYICVHTPHVRDTGRSPHGAGPGATETMDNSITLVSFPPLLINKDKIPK